MDLSLRPSLRSQQSFNRLYAANSAFSPLSLEPVLFCDLTAATALRSTTDLTPCGPGDPCGFLLDHSAGAGYSGGAFTGLGPELVTNGTFDTDLSGWTVLGDCSVSNGAVVIADVGGTDGVLSQQLSGLMTGDVAILTFSQSAGTNLIVQVGNVAGSNFDGQFSGYGVGSHEVLIVAKRDNPWITFRSFFTDTSNTIDNISVRELPGNHAIQSVNADFRPTKKANGVAFDGIDDFLLTPQIDLSGTSELTVVMGLLSIGGNLSRIMWEFGEAFNGAGSAYLSTEFYLNANVGGIGYVQRRVGADQSPGVITVTFRRDGSAPDIRKNGVSVTGTVSLSGTITGPFGNYTMSLGARETGTGAAAVAASVSFGGGLIVVPRALTEAEMQSCEAWVAERAGITL